MAGDRVHHCDGPDCKSSTHCEAGELLHAGWHLRDGRELCDRWRARRRGGVPPRGHALDRAFVTRLVPLDFLSLTEARRSRRKRMKGLEPSTFAMARRRSSQLSYIRRSS
jgi:hypothetical protein